MKTLVTANQKGGVGKTAIVVHLAFDFAERGLKVAVVDLDTQGNASYTLNDSKTGLKASDFFGVNKIDLNSFVKKPEEAGIYLIESDPMLADMEKMSLESAGSNFRNNLSELDKMGFDVCLIDTAPSLGICMATGLIGADYVISPMELEVYSIQGIKKMNAVISNIRQVNNKLKFLGMIPSKVDNRKPRHKRHLEELSQAFPSLMFPVSVGLRDSIADALASGVPVWKIRKTAARKAVKEVRELANLVFTKMEISV